MISNFSKALGRRFGQTLGAVGFATLALASPLSAASILTDIPVGGVDTTWNYFNPSNTAFNTLFNTDHSINMVADYTNPASFNGMDAVWVNAHHNSSGVFSATEANNVRDFIMAGHKGVIITDNAGWSAFNIHVETIIGATITDACGSSGMGTGSHPLASGVGAVNHGCGSMLDPAPNAEVIITNGIASLYTVGLGEVLVITSVDQFLGATPAQPQFMQNISTYLGEPLVVSQVPLPASVPLLLTGLGVMAFAGRRKAKRSDA